MSGRRREERGRRKPIRKARPVFPRPHLGPAPAASSRNLANLARPPAPLLLVPQRHTSLHDPLARGLDPFLRFHHQRSPPPVDLRSKAHLCRPRRFLPCLERPRAGSRLPWRPIRAAGPPHRQLRCRLSTAPSIWRDQHPTSRSPACPMPPPHACLAAPPDPAGSNKDAATPWNLLRLELRHLQPRPRQTSASPRLSATAVCCCPQRLQPRAPAFVAVDRAPP
ncbi:WAS/WASL-interacting protein family member 2-like [Triticum urartu]|uniref:WAS/WASL-interacting protein family member 2-like n=1 Tax=Triticum urartu TaxID=4572 RepID=UPI002042ECBD|nr:WAS/WASL-interacting protein family member 2-like [Triticum urartu]